MQHALAHIDWTAVGAVAGPVLALIALGWQATERLRRPRVQAHYNVSSDGEVTVEAIADDDWKQLAQGEGYVTTPSLQARVLVINSRPTPVIVESVSLEARTSRRRWEALSSDVGWRQIGPASDDTWKLSKSFYTRPRDLRIVVRFIGARRVRTPVARNTGADSLADVRRYITEEHERKRRLAERKARQQR